MGCSAGAGAVGAVVGRMEDAGLGAVSHAPMQYQQHQYDDRRQHQQYDDRQQQEIQQLWHSEPSSDSFDRRAVASASALSNDTFGGDAWGGGGGGGGTTFEKRGNLFQDESIPPPLVSGAGGQAAGTGGCVLWYMRRCSTSCSCTLLPGILSFKENSLGATT